MITYDPWSDHEVDETRLRAHEKRTFRIQLCRQLFQFPQEVSAMFLKTFDITRRLVLQEAMERRDDPRGREVCPYPCACASIRVLWEKMWRVFRVGLLQELANHRAFEERLIVIL